MLHANFAFSKGLPIIYQITWRMQLRVVHQTKTETGKQRYVLHIYVAVCVFVLYAWEMRNGNWMFVMMTMLGDDGRPNGWRGGGANASSTWAEVAVGNKCYTVFSEQLPSILLLAQRLHVTFTQSHLQFTRVRDHPDHHTDRRVVVSCCWMLLPVCLPWAWNCSECTYLLHE